MKITIKVNAENGKTTFNVRYKEYDDDSVRVMNVGRQLVDAFIRGAGDKIRTDAQMPVCPFKIFVTILKVKHHAITAHVDYSANKHCTSGMMAVGVGVVKNLKEMLESFDD